MDVLDARILLAIDDDPEATSLALAKRLGIARNTLHARLQRLRADGVVREFSRRVDPAALGHGLVAFVSVTLSQTSGRLTTAALAQCPEVVEMHSTTGEADLLLKVVAKDSADLHRISGEFIAVPGVVRTSTVISLREELPPRTRALIEQAAAQRPPQTVRPRRNGSGAARSTGSPAAVCAETPA
ncbi:Lrp/AsnC family transcriptional regulator [Streptomyces broussonetiae]|uniref:Lrp/AsnC family transcriptional regulator n=1 Tax=Streptomyces broussonetiae TaxID=2686304 RepID=UPI0035E04379